MFSKKDNLAALFVISGLALVVAGWKLSALFLIAFGASFLLLVTVYARRQ